MKRHAIFLARWAGRGAFKATALVLAFVIIAALWIWNASLLTTTADQNLRIIKALTQLLPPDWASKAESALRIFGADRALLLVEGIAIAKLSMLAIAYPFRRGDNFTRAHLRVRAGPACRADGPQTRLHLYGSGKVEAVIPVFADCFKRMSR